MPLCSLLLMLGLLNIHLEETPIAEGLRQIPNLAFLVFLICFFIIIYSLKKQGRFLESMWNELFRQKENKSIFSEPNKNEFWAKALFIGQTLLLLSLFAFVIYCYEISENAGTLFFLFFTGAAFVSILLFFLIKALMVNIMGNIFFPRSQVKLWNNNYFSILSLSGFLFYIPLVLLFYIPDSFLFCYYFIIISLILVFLLVIYRTYAIFFRHKGASLYFILYLCTQEILTPFMFYKGMMYLLTFVQNNSLWTKLI